MAVVAAILAAGLAVAAPAVGEPDPNRPPPYALDPDAKAGYLMFLENRGVFRTLRNMAGMNVPNPGFNEAIHKTALTDCVWLNDPDRSVDELINNSPFADFVEKTFVVGAVAYYCPWNKDRIPDLWERWGMG